MKKVTFSTEDEWLEARKGKITGSVLKDVVPGSITKDMIMKELDLCGTPYLKTAVKAVLEALLTPESRQKILKSLPKKAGFWEVLSQRVALPPTDENVMDRGHRLEIDALDRFSRETGKKVDPSLVMWYSDLNDSIAVSPDGSIDDGVEAVECKCLSSAKHVEAYFTREIPDEYHYQVLQYFIVNEKLQKLYFVFYDPRMPKDFFHFEFNRADMEQEIAEIFAYEQQLLSEVAEYENQLTF